MAQQQYDRLVKILMIGDAEVGKSVFYTRYVDGVYTDSYIPTIGIDFKIKTIELDGKVIKFQIWDTAGQERFQTITTAYYRGAMGMILMYDTTNEKSFDHITTTWIPLINEHASLNVQVILVGHKADLESKREISWEKGDHFAQQVNIPFLETSAKDNTNIEKAFETLTRLILNEDPTGFGALNSNKEAIP